MGGKSEGQVILGIDPGSKVMGYGVLRGIGNDITLMHMGVVQLMAEKDYYLRLGHIFAQTLKIIQEYEVESIALEAPFFGKNIQSMLKLGRAQGVAMAAALSLNLPIFEYAPRKIKQAITGNGNASKEQVAGFLQRSLNFAEIPKFMDATDAVAVAVCHYYNQKSPQKRAIYNDWSEFVKKNPDRIT